ncbi:hypothetical protein [Pontibacter rugosus]|uniref:Uncharacterized protein n=1 Tax=Pontibacter rugosus TaxID=1745966 RepID=A0ABW3SMK8_9BACT
MISRTGLDVAHGGKLNTAAFTSTTCLVQVYMWYTHNFLEKFK